MFNWYFSKEDLLRILLRLDGIDYMIEICYRREGICFIMSCGNKMRLYFFILCCRMYFCIRVFFKKIDVWIFSNYVERIIDYIVYFICCIFRFKV